MRIIYIALMVVICMATGCSASSSAMSGTVIDAENNKPIEGAVVLVEWTKRHGIGDYHTESVKVVEVMTDKDGKFKVEGILDPFVGPPDVTVYKKGYVAWSSRAIFPDNVNRTDFSWRDQYVFKLKVFKEGYSHNKHIMFIRTQSNDSLASDRKKNFVATYEWEVDLARSEVLREK